MLTQRALIMELGETANGFNLTKDMILKSLDSFINAPIVYVDKQALKIYSAENIVKGEYDYRYVIGLITGNIEIIDNEVYADVQVWDKHLDRWNGRYDNWCIQLNNQNDSFVLECIECF